DPVGVDRARRALAQRTAPARRPPAALLAVRRAVVGEQPEHLAEQRRRRDLGRQLVARGLRRLEELGAETLVDRRLAQALFLEQPAEQRVVQLRADQLVAVGQLGR